MAAKTPSAGGLEAFERVLLAGNRGLIVAMMAAMVALVFTNVVSRYIFNISIIWAEEQIGRASCRERVSIRV